MEDEQDGHPVPEHLRPVRLVDVRPGRAKDPETGPPIAILRLRTKHGVEQPLCLFLEDVRKLAIDLLAIVAHHDQTTPEQVICDYLPVESPAAEPAGDSTGTPVPEQRAETPKAISKVEMTFDDPSIKSVLLHLLCGYRLRRRRLVLLRCDDLGVLTFAEVARGRRITFTMRMTEAGAMRCLAGANVRLDGVLWRKIAEKEVRTWAKGKPWMYVAFQRVSKPLNGIVKKPGSR